MVLQIQKLCGFLNFLCRCIVLGHVFTRRLYSVLGGLPSTAKDGKSIKLKPYHHVQIKEENCKDLEVWGRLLEHPGVYCHSFTDFGCVSTAQDIFMYSDASGKLGFGALCGTSWMYGAWDKDFVKKQNPSIEYLELIALTAGVIQWICRFANRHVCLFCDNISVVHMLNNTTSTCWNCMLLLRLVTLEAMVRNVKISAKYVTSKDHFLSDALSRLDLARFRRLGPQME